MVRNIRNREKDYVDATIKVDDEGIAHPLDITFYERDESGIKIGKGKTFEVDQVLDRRPASALKVGGSGERFTIRIGRSTTFLFREYPDRISDNSRWFVEAKVYEDGRNHRG